jgi:hypothetical protein
MRLTRVVCAVVCAVCAVSRSVCLFPLFYLSREDTATDRSAVWSVLMLLWFRASRSAHSPTTHKCCFLPPVFYCSSSACPRCF